MSPDDHHFRPHAGAGPPSHKPLIGQLALVTGSTRGIGAAIARALAASGASVIVHGQTAKAEAQQVAQACRAEGTYAAALCADVRDESAVNSLFQQITETAGSPSILVLSAGTAYEGLLTDMRVQDWDDLVNVHLRGAFLCARAALPAMARARFGRVIVVSSVWGIVGAAGEVAYSACKGGLIAWTKALAKEWASSGITVNAVAPGAIETAMMAQYTASELAQIVADTPGGRLGQPTDVATAVCFLASPQASYVTGQVLAIDGGWTLG